jgi:hypothetical protein
MVRPGMYDAACSQKTPRKNSRNESNISMKKYHQRPTFGVKSEKRSRTPYVAPRKSHEPVMNADPESNAPTAAARLKVCVAVKDHTSDFDCVFAARASYRRTRSGGNRSMGCMDMYAARARDKTKVMLAPCAALAMAVRTKRFERADVERARQVAMVNGLNRKPAAMARLLHLRCLLEDVKRRVATFCPLSAICARAFALKRSTAVYSRFVAMG